MISRWWIVGALAVLTACGGSSEAADDTGEAETTGGEDEAGMTAEPTWPDMSPEQRGAYMREVVMPEMRALFQEHDAERYADFGCGTCHGEDAREVGFEMPNGLAPLDPSQIGAVFQSEEPMAQFMTQTVWPRMAALLDEPPYDMETQEGFSCLRCHATAEGE